MDYNKEFPNFGYVLGYFHQSWSSVYDWQGKKPDFESVIRYCKTHNGLNRIVLATNEGTKLINLSLSEEELEEAVDEFTTSGFSPFNTHREFFDKVLEILKEPMEKTKKEFVPEFIG